MKNRFSVKYTLLCGTACCFSSMMRAQQDVSRMNVLFIMADDMRPVRLLWSKGSEDT